MFFKEVFRGANTRCNSVLHPGEIRWFLTALFRVGDWGWGEGRTKVQTATPYAFFCPFSSFLLPLSHCTLLSSFSSSLFSSQSLGCSERCMWRLGKDTAAGTINLLGKSGKASQRKWLLSKIVKDKKVFTKWMIRKGAPVERKILQTKGAG